jgi:hypothetical protein
MHSNETGFLKPDEKYGEIADGIASELKTSDSKN